MEFKTKSAEELKGMDAEALHSYYVEKLNHENEVLESRLKSLEDEKNSEKHEELAKAVKELKEQSIATLKSALKEQGKVIKGLKDGSISGGKLMETEGTIEKALQDNADKFKSAKESKEEFSFDLNLKAVGDMTFANNLSGGNMPQAQRLAGINNIAEVPNAIYPRMAKLSTSANVIDWVYETGQEGAASGTAEGVLKNQIDNNFVVTSVALLKQTAYFKVSTEMLSDVSFMASWLRNKLIVRLMLRIDSQILNGDGTGTNLNGLVPQATTSAAGTFANTVDLAHDADSLVVEEYDNAFPKLNIDEDSYIVIYTTGHAVDERCLQFAAGTRAKYIGMIGSKKKAREVKERLLQKGISQQQMDRVYSPIGIEIGAETPEEIAISILAEITTVKRSGGSARGKRA